MGKEESSFSEEKEAKRLSFSRWPALIFFAGIMMALPAEAKRVVSLNLCVDQLLLLLAPEDAVAISFLARDPRLSYVAGLAQHIPAISADAEAVLALRPDLVLAGVYGAATAVGFLKSHVPVEQFADPTDFLGIAANIARLAALLGVQRKGQALIEAMQAKLAALPHTQHGRAIVWQPAGYTAGPNTMEDAILRQAGWRNAGTVGRLGLEALMASRPDLLVTETTPGFPSLATDLLHHPAIATLPVRRLPPPLTICPGPYTPEAVAILSRP